MGGWVGGIIGKHPGMEWTVGLNVRIMGPHTVY